MKINFSNSDAQLREGFSEWNSELPSDAVFEKIQESLTLENIWSELEVSLTEEKMFNEPIKDSFDQFSTESPKDIWGDLDEKLSQERVWMRLNESLDACIKPRFAWWKMLAASVVFFFLSTFINSPNFQKVNSFTNSENITGVLNNSSSKVNNSNLINDLNKETVVFSEDVKNVKRIQYNLSKEILVENIEENKLDNSTNKLEKINSNEVLVQNIDISFNEEDRSELLPISLSFEDNKLNKFSFKKTKGGFTPARIGIELGTQVSLLTQNTEEEVQSLQPRLGFVGALSLNRNWRKITFEQQFSFAQYQQTNGTFEKGGYNEGVQRINSLQLGANVGYQFKYFSLYTGAFANKVISGTEKRRNTITSIYERKDINLGYAFGVNIPILQLKNGVKTDIGMQYNITPYKDDKSFDFDKIHGLKLSAKILF